MCRECGFRFLVLGVWRGRRGWTHGRLAGGGAPPTLETAGAHGRGTLALPLVAPLRFCAATAAPRGLRVRDALDRPEPGSADRYPSEDRQEDMAVELKRLKRENEILRQERDILKKATAFFAKEGSRSGRRTCLG